jgi:hypothetical protein
MVWCVKEGDVCKVLAFKECSEEVYYEDANWITLVNYKPKYLALEVTVIKLQDV